MGKVCETCRFSVITGPYGRCHRYPANVHVQKHDWCGEWKEMEKSAKNDNITGKPNSDPVSEQSLVCTDPEKCTLRPDGRQIVELSDAGKLPRTDTDAGVHEPHAEASNDNAKSDKQPDAPDVRNRPKRGNPTKAR